MHNRARLIVGSFLTKDLHLDWRHGEAHFMRYLLVRRRGEQQRQLAVDLLGRRRPGAAFRRMYNPVPQQERHDPDGDYVRRWVPGAARRPAARWPSRGRAPRTGGGRLRDRPRLPGADRRPQRERERALERYRAVAG